MRYFLSRKSSQSQSSPSAVQDSPLADLFLDTISHLFLDTISFLIADTNSDLFLDTIPQIDPLHCPRMESLLTTGFPLSPSSSQGKGLFLVVIFQSHFPCLSFLLSPREGLFLSFSYPHRSLTHPCPSNLKTPNPLLSHLWKCSLSNSISGSPPLFLGRVSHRFIAESWPLSLSQGQIPVSLVRDSPLACGPPRSGGMI